MITLGEHRIRPFHSGYTLEYLQHDKSGSPTKWKESPYYPGSFEQALVRLSELELKRRGRTCSEAAELLEVVRAMRDEIVALGSV